MAISRIDVFIRNAHQTTTPHDVQKACVAELKYLRANYQPFSLRRALTNYRNAIKKENFEDNKQSTLLKSLVMTLDEKAAMSKKEYEQVSNDLNNLRPIHEIDKYIDVATTLLSDNSYLIQVVGLCALTGRRSAEIGCTAKFELCKDENKLLFSGQLKTKDRGDLPAYEIPVLCEPSKIIETIEALRAKKPQFINDTVKFHDAASKELNRRVKRFFPFVSDAPLSTKDLRSIYGELNFMFEDNPTIAKSKYISNILGHSEDDITTGQSYLDFYIEDENYR